MDLPYLFLLLSSFLYFCSPAALEDEGIKIADADVDVRVVEGRKITGNDCEYIKLCEVLNNTSCSNGDKFVIRKMRGTRRQFLILNGRPVMGFRQKKKKFSSCPSFTQITATLQCKEVAGLNSLNISTPSNTSATARSLLDIVDDLNNIEILENVPVEKDEIVERVIKGNNCEFVRLCDVTNNTGCSDGNKLVLKKQKGLRRQFLLLNGSPVLGFIMRKKKFTSCEAYKDVTDNSGCSDGNKL